MSMEDSRKLKTRLVSPVVKKQLGQSRAKQKRSHLASKTGILDHFGKHGLRNDATSDVTRNEDGTESIRLPDGTVVPFVSSKALKTPPPADGPDLAKETATAPGKRKPKIDPKALEQFMSRGAAAPAPAPTPRPADDPEK